MELLNLSGLAWLALVPLLVVPYLVRERPRRRTVSALFLFHGSAPARRMRLGGRPRLEPLIVLQLLALLLALAALCRPASVSIGARSALVLDDSISLGAKTKDGTTRIELARRAATYALRTDPADGWDVYHLAPEPAPAALGVGRGRALEEIERLAPTSCAHPGDSVIQAFLGALAEKGYRQIHVVTDRRAESRPPFEVVTVGDPQPNLAITDFRLLAERFGADRGRAAVTVANYGATPAGVGVTIDAPNGARVANGRLEIPPGRSASLAAPVTADGRYQARIDAEDALPADNRATASLGAKRALKVLLVSAGRDGLGSLPAELGLAVETVKPSDYRPEIATGRDLVIFHLSAPAEPPPAPALYLLPPAVPFLPRAAGSTSDVEGVALPAPTHPAVRYLAPGALLARRALVFGDAAGWQPLAVATAGPLVLAREASIRSAVSGIDLLPYLGARNRPVSILTLDLLGWLTGGEPARSTEACSAIGTLDSDLRAARALSLPEGPAPRPGPRRTTTPLWPAFAWSALAVLVIEAWLERPAGVAPLLVRLLVGALLVAAALDPARTVPAPPPAPTLLVDVSKSLLPPTRNAALAAAAEAAGPPAAVIAFASRPVPSDLARLSDAGSAADAGATDLEAALSSLATALPEESRVLVVSDGWETRGDARRTISLLRERRIRLYPFADEQEVPANVALERLALPPASVAGASARAEILLRNDNPVPVQGRVALAEAGRAIAGRAVELRPGDNLVTEPVLITAKGLVEFTARFEAADRTRNRLLDDDAASAWVATRSGQPLVLVGRSRRDDRDLARALEARGFEVRDVEARAGQPLPRPGSAAAVVLHDVSLADLPRSYPEELESYVRAGGGLLVVGGPHSYGLGGYFDSPLEEALPVRSKPRSRDEPRSTVALVIDKSGSMREEERMLFAKEAARQLVERLNDHDRLTVIGFDREAFVVVPLREVGDIRDDFEQRIDRLKPAGGTRLYPALVEAERALVADAGRRRHVIVLSDGLSEDAETSAGRRRYYDLALALSEENVTISTIALGRDADADFLERLASYGRGAFHETRDPSTLPELILGELGAHAKERTLDEAEITVRPSVDSPVVGEVARAVRRWPPVFGLVETVLRPRARLDVGTSAPGAPPLVASWQYGSGRAVAVTTDANGRWSDRWVRWPQWSRLWGDIAGWIAPAPEQPEESFALGYRDGALQIDYARFDRDPADALTARVAGPGKADGEVAMVRAAPGYFRASFPTRTPGDYRVEIGSARGPVTRTPIGFTLAASAVGERPRREPDWPLLEALAEATGGRVNARAGEIEPAPAPGEKRPLAPYLIPPALILFIAELVLRRIRRATPTPALSRSAAEGAPSPGRRSTA